MFLAMMLSMRKICTVAKFWKTLDKGIFLRKVLSGTVILLSGIMNNSYIYRLLFLIIYVKNVETPVNWRFLG